MSIKERLQVMKAIIDAKDISDAEKFKLIANHLDIVNTQL